jgi:hypothetical protein
MKQLCKRERIAALLTLALLLAGFGPTNRVYAATINVTAKIIRVNEGRFMSEVIDGRQVIDRPAAGSERRAWLLLVDPLPNRIFFDCGIVEGLRQALPDRLAGIFLADPAPDRAGANLLAERLSRGRVALTKESEIHWYILYRF